MRYALETRFAITPLGCSRFVVHPKAGGPNDEQVARIVEALAQIALTTWTTHGMIVHFPLLELLRSLQTSRIAYRDSQTQYDASRERFWPWILNPQAWGMRSRRNQQRARLQAVNAAIRSQIVSVRDATAATHSQGH